MLYLFLRGSGTLFLLLFASCVVVVVVVSCGWLLFGLFEIYIVLREFTHASASCTLYRPLRFSLVHEEVVAGGLLDLVLL